jgi:hypothetical protein
MHVHQTMARVMGYDLQRQRLKAVWCNEAVCIIFEHPVAAVVGLHLF